MVSSMNPEFDAIVVGTGFSGIRTLWELTRLGLSVKCFEAGTDVGGTWYWNRYPGARTDSEAWVYNMNFVPELKDDFAYSERYPSGTEVQAYITRITDRFNLRHYIQFNSRVRAANWSDTLGLWTITLHSGESAICRFFIPATGPLSIPKNPPFDGLESFKGEWYHAAKWPKHHVDFRNKRVAVVGTGATGVQLIPKLATVAKELIVLQRTPNYVLPGRNYVIDEYHRDEIKEQYANKWEHASAHPFGLAMYSTGKTMDNVSEAEIRSILDCGWEAGGFHYQFETFDDLFTNQRSNSIASDYLRSKIQAIVKDSVKAELLTPKYAFLSKRPPCGHHYYETFNRSNVTLVDIRQKDLSLYEQGIRTSSGEEHEADIVIFALGFDAGTGALNEIDVRGTGGQSLKSSWSKELQTFAGVLVPSFPNMFSVCGPHIPFGNMPVVLDIEVRWIGKVLGYMKENKLEVIDVKEGIAAEWSAHLSAAFKATLFGESAKKAGAWFVGSNIPGKSNDVLFYFGGVGAWASWLDRQIETNWQDIKFGRPVAVH